MYAETPEGTGCGSEGNCGLPGCESGGAVRSEEDPGTCAAGGVVTPDTDSSHDSVILLDGTLQAARLSISCMHNRKHRAGLLIGISCFTLLNLLISAWIIYTQASCCEQSIEIPTLLGLQITAASLLFLLASVTLGVLG